MGRLPLGALGLLVGLWAGAVLAHDPPIAASAVGLEPDAEYDYVPPKAGTYRLPVLKRAGDGVVLDESGRAHRLRDLLGGRITVLGLVYTRCADPQGCPLVLSLFDDLLDRSDRDPDLGARLRLVALSFDPEHDTPDEMARLRGTDPSTVEQWYLTTTGPEALAPLLAAYGQPVGRKTDPDDPLGPFTHQLRVFLIDRQARIRNIYSLGFIDPRLVVADIRTLLLGEKDAVSLTD